MHRRYTDVRALPTSFFHSILYESVHVSHLSGDALRLQLGKISQNRMSASPNYSILKNNIMLNNLDKCIVILSCDKFHK